jgi:hypothetical protein
MYKPFDLHLEFFTSKKHVEKVCISIFLLTFFYLTDSIAQIK